MDVGALARQLVASQPLISDLAARDGGNAQARVIARLIEAARIVLAMQAWLSELDPRHPCILAQAVPTEGEGAGLTEAARGSLGHWVRVQGGAIRQYQIIAPTTWNFSPRDAQGTPGPWSRRCAARPWPAARPSQWPCSTSCDPSTPAWSAPCIEARGDGHPPRAA